MTNSVFVIYRKIVPNEVEVRYINELKPQNDISLMNSNFTQLTKFSFFIFNNSKEKLTANL